MKQNLFLTFPQRVLNEPLIYVLGRDFKLVPNIRGASITDQHGMMALELVGEQEEIDRAVAFLRARDVQVELVRVP